MKKTITLIASLLITISSAFAQSENPVGLYRLQRLSYDNGQPDHIPEFVQYKYCSSTPLTLIVAVASPDDYRFTVRYDEPRPYIYTGKTPVGEDGKGTEIFDSNKNHFSLKWYNNCRYDNKIIFPMNQFITEHYDKNNIEECMSRAIEMLEMKGKPATHRFGGCWKFIGNVGKLDGQEIIVTSTAQMYKIYGQDDVTCYFVGNGTGTVFYWPLEVKSDNEIIERVHDCSIQWRSNDAFVLTFLREDGKTVKELWIRSGLPESMQKIFGTNVPVKNVEATPSF